MQIQSAFTGRTNAYDKSHYQQVRAMFLFVIDFAEKVNGSVLVVVGNGKGQAAPTTDVPWYVQCLEVASV